MSARILAIGTAVPRTALTQDAARDIFLRQPGMSRLAARLTTAAFDASGITSRYTVRTKRPAIDWTSHERKLPSPFVFRGTCRTPEDRWDDVAVAALDVAE